MKKTSRRKFGSQLAGAMAALPVAALVTQAQDKEKDKEKEKKKQKPRADDPPILVGGGGGSRLDRSGSTYIWVHRSLIAEPGTLQATPAVNTDPQYDIPGLPIARIKQNYFCYEIQNLELGSYETHDGGKDGDPHDVKERRKHCTRFYRSS